MFQDYEQGEVPCLFCDILKKRDRCCTCKWTSMKRQKVTRSETSNYYLFIPYLCTLCIIESLAMNKIFSKQINLINQQVALV